MDVAKKPHSLDKNEVAQPELYFSTRKIMEEKIVCLERALYLHQVKSLRDFYCEPMKTYENQEKEKDKNEVAQPEEYFSTTINMHDEADLKNWKVCLKMKRNKNRKKGNDKNEVAQPEVEGLEESSVRRLCFLDCMVNCNDKEGYFKHLTADWIDLYCEKMKTNENREKEKDKNKVARSFYTSQDFSSMINCDDEMSHLEPLKARHLEQVKALWEVYCEPMKTYENQEKEKDKNEVAQPEEYFSTTINKDHEEGYFKQSTVDWMDLYYELMKTNENREKEKDKNKVARSFYTSQDFSTMTKCDDEAGYFEHFADFRALCAMMKTNENREKEKDKNEVAQSFYTSQYFSTMKNCIDKAGYFEQLRADSGASYAMTKTNENREKEKDKKVAQPEVEGFDESFDPNDRKYLENPSVIAVNPDDELEYWKHWEAYEKKNENREKDKKEVAEPEEEGLDESFDPNDEVKYWKRGKAYEKKNEIDDREKEKED